MRVPQAPIAAVALLSLAACAGGRPYVRASAKVGQPLALDASDLGGHRLDLSEGQGKVRVVDFWASWCEPCKEYFPALDRLYLQQRERGLAVYAVSFDEDSAQVQPFLNAFPVHFGILWDKGGAANATRYEVARLPTTLLVDRRGVIRFVHEGYDDETFAEERRQIEQLLAEQ
ncbi:MAG TPA: TlpA disulfide reductase family protein [Anaeromyxobacteraceae bacterium]|jgi:thiol-disulfide isomerase/thioredoxin|nr:TlpA disulfide reductase family protein [Anaeromyxobacteraceae bacterium]